MEISALDHDIKQHEAKAATCTEIGWEAYETCEREGCEYTTYAEIPALDHDIKQHEAKAATCAEVGWNAYEACAREGCDYTTYEEIPTTEHTPITDAHVEATSSQTGLSEGSHCDVCGTILIEQKTLYYLSVTVHNPDYGKVQDYKASLAAGEQVELEVTVYDDHGFAGWYLNNVKQSENAQYVYTMPKKNTTLKAVFSIYPDMDVWFGDVSTSFAGGNGTESNPYLIKTGAQLAGLARLINTDTTSYLSAYYKLVKSIDLNGYNWTPIGSNSDEYESEFGGNFNGNHKIVYGVKLREISGVNYYGLFGGLYRASVYDLNVEGVDINITGVSDKIYRVGSLCGNVYDCEEMKNIITSGKISLYCDGESYIGGVVGRSNSALSLSNCESSCNIQCQAPQVALVVGGVLGLTEASVSFTNCGHKGSIAIKSSAECDVGGVLGEVTGANRTVTLTDCYHIGDINAVSTGAMDVGGIAAYYADHTRCFAEGNITVSTGDKQISVGGIGSQGWTATDCYYVGDIKTTNGDGKFYVGGIFGQSGTVKNAITVGSISVTNADDSKSITPDSFAAGIIGYTSGGSATNCATKMSIAITNSEGVKDDEIGYIATYSPTITNCYKSHTSTLFHNGEQVGDSEGFSDTVTANTFKTSGFYTSDLGWSSSVWDVSTVTTLGYATLKKAVL